MVEWYRTLTPEQEAAWVAAAKAGQLETYLQRRGDIDIDENIRQQAAERWGVSVDDIVYGETNLMPRLRHGASRAPRTEQPKPVNPIARVYEGDEAYRRRLEKLFS